MPTGAASSSYGPETNVVDIVIIGAGLSGLVAAAYLKKEGIDSFIGAVGGTWRDHHFPNAGTDTEVPTYYPSFLPTPETSSQFGERDEILSYFAPVFAHFRPALAKETSTSTGFPERHSSVIAPAGHHCNVRSGHLNATFGGKDMGSIDGLYGSDWTPLGPF
ncbi:hypothetical protein EMIHUDRAFT_217233 [Emiliania huxleyi CCMP1516]|uniref:Uncharacterized protein n=2 Tax=Emiliania huxleyi TaxID=2903 RepID=A0A0D3IBA2_EMIH1|nr:hypothetical protein EMIHUDRAFT_217233 [Emiliania huxleyi CCMP1516]EOD08537.1 hypothetical protein EMIHUDRAFT_217233 [Emiliania huxleyi CCMP1516]|eukprot:XP_005760966.1 hypothetical protein EMIHUDRAFT_217233 [Emiliania huxleyi CCMP1516]